MSKDRLSPRRLGRLGQIEKAWDRWVLGADRAVKPAGQREASLAQRVRKLVRQTLVALDPWVNLPMMAAAPAHGSMMDTLEPRKFLSVAASPDTESVLSSTLTSQDRPPVVAMDASGDFVVAWMDTFSGGYTSYASVNVALYRADGSDVTAFSLGTNADHPGYLVDVDVAMDADGDFVVVWTDPSDASIHGSLHNADGSQRGSEFILAPSLVTMGTIFTDVAVAMDADGDFVVVAEVSAFTSSGPATVLYAQSFNAAGGHQSSIIGLAQTMDFYQPLTPSVAIDGDGDRFVVAWRERVSEYSDYTRVRAAAVRHDGIIESYATLDGDAANQVNLDTDVAVDASGNFLVAWSQQGQGIFGHNVDNTGQFVGTAFQLVADPTTAGTAAVSLAMDAEGDFVVAWSSDGVAKWASFESGSSSAATSGQLGVLYTTGGTDVAVAMDAEGDFVGVWDFYYYSNASIAARRFNGTVTSAAPAPVVGSAYLRGVSGDPDWLLANNTNVPAMSADGVRLSFSQLVDRTQLLNLANWTVTRNGAPVNLAGASIDAPEVGSGLAHQATLILAGAFDAPGRYEVTLNDDVDSEFGTALDGDLNGAAGGDYHLTFFREADLIPPFEDRVNDATDEDQWDPAVAVNAEGDMVVVWVDEYYDQYGYGPNDYYSPAIFGRFYDAYNGEWSSAFRVNVDIDSREYAPTVAMDADGDFIVAWVRAYGEDYWWGSPYYYTARYGSDDNYYSLGSAIYARRFDRTGVPQGPDFRVDSLPRELVLGRYDLDDSEWDYDRVTLAVGAPTIAMDANGDFVVAWQAFGQSLAETPHGDIQYYSQFDYYDLFTAGWDIYARRFDATGIAQGIEARVNAATSGHAINPSVAMDGNGDYVVAWNTYHGYHYHYVYDYDYDYENSGPYGYDVEVTGNVLARRFTNNGTGGCEFQVNQYTLGYSSHPSAAIDADGDIAIAWQNEYAVDGRRRRDFGPSSYDGPLGFGVDGSGVGVAVRLFDGANAPLTGEQVVNTFRQGDQEDPVVAFDSTGAFFVAWTSYGDEDAFPKYYGPTGGIVGRRYDANGAPTTAPALINPFTDGDQYEPAIAIDGRGDIHVVYTSYYDAYSSTSRTTSFGPSFSSSGPHDGDEGGIYYTRIERTEGLDLAAPVIGTIEMQNSDGSGLMHIVDEGGQINEGEDRIRFSFSEEVESSLGSGLYDLANYGLFRGATPVDIQYVAVDTDGKGNSYILLTLDDQLLTPGEYTLVVYAANITNDDGVALDGNRDGVGGDDFTFNFVVPHATTDYVPDQVNWSVSGFQQAPAVAMDASGDWAIAFTSTDTPWGWNYSSEGGVIVHTMSPAHGEQEFRVSPPQSSVGSYRDVEVAMDADGDFVVVWLFNGGGSPTVYARRFGLDGPKGPAFAVDTPSTHNVYGIDVAMDAEGDFAIVTEGQSTDYPFVDVYRFNADGSTRDVVPIVSDSTYGYISQASIASDDDGDLVVVWDHVGGGGGGQQVWAQRISTGGALVGSVLQVSDGQASVENYQPVVAMDSDGDFAIAWTSYYRMVEEEGYSGRDYYSYYAAPDGSISAVMVRRYSAAGVPQGAAVIANEQTVGYQESTGIALDDAGNLTVVWTDYYGKGVKDVVGTNDFFYYGYGDWDVFFQRYDASGSPVDGNARVNDFDLGTQGEASVAVDDDGDFLIAYSSMYYGSPNMPVYGGSVFQDSWYGPSAGVYARGYTVRADNGARPVDTSAPQVTGVYNDNDDAPILEGQFLTSEVDALVVAFSEEVNSTTSGPTYGNSVRNLANWHLTRNGVDVTGDLLDVTFGYNSSTERWEARATFAGSYVAGNFVLTLANVQDINGVGLDHNYDGVTSGPFVRTFAVREIVAIGSEFTINSTLSGYQTTPDVAQDDDGDMVVVWDSYYNGEHTIWARLYDTATRTWGSDFVVNDGTSVDVGAPAVAMDDDGDFAVTWRASDPGNPYGGDSILVRTFAANGTPTGAPQVVQNLRTLNGAIAPDIAMDEDGDFVVVWQGAYAYDAVFASVFDQDGVQSSVVTVGASSVANWAHPAVAADAQGGFVVAWEGNSGGAAILAQQFTNRGAASSSVLQVSEFSGSSSNRLPAVAVDNEGDFVVAWSSTSFSGMQSIVARQFEGDGSAGSRWTVNLPVSSSGAATNAAVAMDENGDFVITWQQNQPSANGFDIEMSRFNALGEQQGSQLRVNSSVVGNQVTPAVAINALGAFYVVWEDTNGSDIKGQAFDTNTAPYLQGAIPDATMVRTGVGVSINLFSFFEDAESGNNLTYTVAGLTDGSGIVGTAGIAGGLLTITPAGNLGAATFTIRATDAAGLYVEDTFTLTAVDAIIITSANRATFTTNAGRTVTVSLNGPGTGYLELNGSNDMASLTLVGTNLTTTLNVSATGVVPLGAVNVAGSLKAFNASAVNLLGDFLVTGGGYVQALTLGDANAAAQQTINIGGTLASPNGRVSMGFVTNVNFITGAPLMGFTTKTWTDTDPGANRDSLVAPRISSFTINGNLQADVTLDDGIANTTAYSIVSGVVTGNVDGATIRAAGPINTFLADRLINSNLYVGLPMSQAALPSARAEFVNTNAIISKLTIRNQLGAGLDQGMVNSRVSAWQITRLEIKDASSPGPTYGIATSRVGTLVRSRTGFASLSAGPLTLASQSINDARLRLSILET